MARIDSLVQDIVKQRNPDRGILGQLDQIGGSLIAPFTKIANVGVEDISSQAAGTNIFNKDYTPTFMAQEEVDQYRANPLGKAAQDFAGVGSYFIPGGGGVASTIAKGALAGGAQAFANQDLREGLDVGNLAQGALLGGGTAGALKVGGDILSKVRNKGTQKVAGEIAETVGSKPVETIDDFLEVASKTTKPSKLGEVGRTLEYKKAGITAQPGDLDITGGFSGKLDRYDKALKAFNLPRDVKGISQLPEKYNQLIDNALDNSTKTFNTTTLTTPNAVAKLKRTLPAGIKATNSELVAAVRSEIGDLLQDAGLSADDFIQGRVELPAGDMMQLKRKLFSVADRVNDKGAKNLQEAVQAYIHDWAKEGVYQVPGVKQINTNYVDLFKDNPGMVRAFNTGLGGAPSASQVQNIPTLLYNQATGQLGKGLSKVDELLQGGVKLPQVPAIAAPAIGAAGSILQKVGSSNLPAAAIGNVASQPMAEAPAIQEEPIQLPQEPIKTQYDDIINLMQQGVDLKTAQGILGQMQGGQQKPPSANDRKLQSITNSGMRALDDIESIANEDSAALLSGNLPSFLQSSNARRINTAISQAADAIGRLRSGGAINKAEEERFRSMLPTWTDDAETKAYKINSLRQSFMDVINPV